MAKEVRMTRITKSEPRGLHSDFVISSPLVIRLFIARFAMWSFAHFLYTAPMQNLVATSLKLDY
jgi:hypothetical protein